MDTGDVKVFFELNGQPREIRVPNRSAKAKTAARAKIQDGNLDQIGAPMPGLVINVIASIGKKLLKGDIILQLEAMKMQSAVTAERNGTLKSITVKIGDQVELKDLIAEWEK